MELIVCEPQSLAEKAASQILAALQTAIQTQGSASLMLAGGSTPGQVYRCLNQCPNFPWEKLTLYFGDERAVPPEHPDSNYHMVMHTLLQKPAVSPHCVHRMAAERQDLAAAAAAYSALLPDAIDVLLLGIGEDGHTASLFPKSAALFEKTNKVVPIEDSPKPPARRLTITPKVIETAVRCFMLASGASKAMAVARALEGPLDIAYCPAQLARHATWIVDTAAIGLLRNQTE